MILSYSEKREIFVDNKKNIVDNLPLQEAEKENTINVNAIIGDNIVSLNLEEYVKGVVACEVPASFDSEALKAMSVAARTFALYKISKGKSIKTTVSDQCYIDNDKMKSKWKSNYNKYYTKISNAVNDTKGEYMTYNDKVIIAFYFSISNGKTENVENVFSQKLDYLVSVDSSWDKKSNYNEKKIKIKVIDFLKKLNIKDNKIYDIKIDRSSTNRVNNIKINNSNYKGTKFRSLLGLRSTDFNITYDNDFVYIHTVGYGHGVGMSQYGANYMAYDGYSYDEILKHYYTGIKITNKL
ncbi:MAG: stage II sporulation protein D [Tenericutes bacterium]|nr:stage II sporulation protein D [Mycoplasmatota bacterium]